MRATLLPFLLLIGVTSQSGVPGPSSDWPHYGGGPEQIRYSPLTQITPANVTSLKVTWTYDTGDAFKGSEMQCQPVVAHGVLYATSPKLRVFALDAATGAEKWSFNPLEAEKTPSRTRIRGLMYWERGPSVVSTSAPGTGSTRSMRTLASRWPASGSRGASTCARAFAGAIRARSASA